MSDKEHRILLIANEAEARVIHRALAAAYVVVEAPNPRRGLEIYESSPPHCVLVDLGLESEPGVDLLARLVRAGTGVPVVVLADPQDEFSAARAMEQGAQAFLPKDGLTAELLRRVVAHALRYSELQRDLEEARGDVGFLSNRIANEFRAPLQRIIELCSEMRESSRSEGDDSAALHLHEVEATAQELSRSVDRLLDYSTAGKDAPPSKSVDLNRVIRSVLADLEDTIRECGAHVEGEHLPTVRGDRESLTRLLRNLLANAMKFQGETSPAVRIGARLKGDMWEISIQDNGIGFDLSQRSAIFNPSKRPRGPAGPAGGGLGLATCRKIVHQHGGRIRVFSEPGKGSIFRFTLPPETPETAGV